MQRSRPFRITVLPTAAAFLALLVTFGCQEAPVAPDSNEGLTASPAVSASPALDVAGEDLELLGRSLDEMNRALAESGSDLRVAKAEWVTDADAALMDRRIDGEPDAESVVFASDRQLRLDSRWAPNDPRRQNPDAVSYVNGQVFGFSAASGVEMGPAVDASFDTWEELQCSGLPISRLQDRAFPSLILSLGGQPGDPGPADIGEVGFLPGFIFDAVLGAGASESVLGVTFSFIWTLDGVPTDIDNDGHNDLAFKEVWYNDAFAWTTDPASEPDAIDLETVAFHENGHALSLGHFGKVHATFNQGAGNDNLGRLHVSPRAAMNAVILGTQRTPLGTDDAAYCGLYGDWPTG